ncbi:hypothetical protein AMECASPLE_024605 [Ameca splendens]|uniref:Uncharacterized protein n=1 Tax=Ameca splendens TaxID=208324 RepID=A0ABV0YG41_9TELE
MFFFFHTAKNILPCNSRPIKVLQRGPINLCDKSRALSQLYSQYCKSDIYIHPHQRGKSPTVFKRLDCCVIKGTGYAQVRASTKRLNDEILRLFNSDTEEQDFDGFSAQEEDEEGGQ